MSGQMYFCPLLQTKQVLPIPVLLLFLQQKPFLRSLTDSPIYLQRGVDRELRLFGPYVTKGKAGLRKANK